ncbi:hypothetical protein Vretimale_11818, partial [Volvox reticuliferus]
LASQPLIEGALDDADLVGNVQGIIVGRKADVRLLLPIGPDQRIDLLGLNVVHAQHGILDLLLVGLKVNDEHQSVVVLNLLHRGLSCQRVLEDGILVKLLERWRADPRILALPGPLQGLRPMEHDGVPRLPTSLESALLNSLGSLCGHRLSVALAFRGHFG